MEKHSKIQVSIVYPADPTGVIPGGIDTCIKGIISWAPEDISFNIIGITTNPDAYPARQWSKCRIGEKTFNFYPLFEHQHPEKQPLFPATLTMMLTLPFYWPAHDYDILQFHRIEPALCFALRKKPQLVFIHQNMEVIESRSSDIRWKYAPFLYYKLEDFLIPRFAGVNIVHEQAVHAYRQRYEKVAEKINFVPTWMDPRIFYPLDPVAKNEKKTAFLKKNKIAEKVKLLISVGRIDHQKNPSLLVKSFAQVKKSFPDVHLLVVGDGVLRKEMEAEISKYGLENHVSLTGILPYTEVAELLRISDLLVLSSRYEGMPRCVIEALGCGVPVATTDVGEVKRVVKTGINGHISEIQDVDHLTAAMSACLKSLSSYSRSNCCDAVTQYTPQNVLEPVYGFYRKNLETNNSH